ncbi:metalloendopeptidase [Tumebacillus avium]|uniref:Metalloendopeptidase n=1 Tax=Tumebacillus avium TaxID=1903704 RepID=A0A1Y0IIA8_9BACL|nr:M23 family metallopeptidase [Tumebacillus avium]ARU60241.1 metalloendopeptidase [Tumebacillus avium]
MKKFMKTLFFPVFLIFGLLISFAPQTASAAPAFQLPFACGQVWSGQTRTDHSPANAIDFNRTDDLGDPVVSSAAGKVITVRDLGSTSYGKYVVVDHGGGWTTYYAHLNSFAVSVGQAVTQGQKLGTVGSTGGSTGPHLHFEQRLNGSAQKVVFNGAQALYWGTKSYTSNNSCGGTYANGTVNTAGADLNVRSGPGTGYAIVGSVSDGQQVRIYCQTYGTTVTGTYGTSNVWNRIGTGQYISDTYVYTGSDGLVAPLCN